MSHRPESVIQEQLDDLEDVLETARKQAQDDFASGLALRQLNLEKEQLEAEIEDAKERES